jgi:hypothetical protein
MPPLAGARACALLTNEPRFATFRATPAAITAVKPRTSSAWRRYSGLCATDFEILKEFNGGSDHEHLL